MPDGSMLRAEVAVEDGSVEVRLHGSEETGAMAVREAQELRDGLEDQGLDLREFEFHAEAEEGEPESDAQGTDGEAPDPTRADFAPHEFDPEADDTQAARAAREHDPELSRGAFVRRRM
jgi:hypothetical protein